MPADTLGSILHLVTGDGKGSSEPADLVSTSRAGRSPLRVDLRVPASSAPADAAATDAAIQQVGLRATLDWKLAAHDDKSCTFTYDDATTSLKKVISLGAEPFELAVDVTVKNLGPTAKKHRFTIEQDAYRTKKEMEGHLGRQSELVTKSVAISTTKNDFELPNDFEPSDFTAKKGFTAENWRRTEGEAKLAAVSSVYFTRVVIPEAGPGTPVAETSIEEVWNASRCDALKCPDPKTCTPAQIELWNKCADARGGERPRPRLRLPRPASPTPRKDLAPGETARYHAVSYTGPKERDILARIDRGAPELLEFGVGFFSFATKDIARGLVWVLYKFYGVVGSWGWAIVLLTISVRTLLFPLSLSQIKNSMAMRKLKPEMDELNAKYKDDAAQRGLAIQELWRKNGVSNPVVGCAPMLLQDAGLVERSTPPCRPRSSSTTSPSAR